MCQQSTFGLLFSYEIELKMSSFVATGSTTPPEEGVGLLDVSPIRRNKLPSRAKAKKTLCVTSQAIMSRAAFVSSK